MTSSTSDKPTPTNKDWLEHWARIAPQLEEIKRKELQEFDYHANLHIIDALLEIGCQMRTPRPTSGLVELQRLFQKAREKEAK